MGNPRESMIELTQQKNKPTKQQDIILTHKDQWYSHIQITTNG